MIYSIIGLSLDLIGVVLLFKYGILPDNLWEHLLMDNGMSESDEKKHKIWSKIAMAFLILGFVFQLLSSVMQHQSGVSNEVIKSNNLDLGADTNSATGIRGTLKVKYANKKILYQLEIQGKIKSIDSIHNFMIELEDKDGFKISKIEILNTSDNVDLTNLVKKDSAFLKIKSSYPFSAKDYQQIKKWELLALRK